MGRRRTRSGSKGAAETGTEGGRAAGTPRLSYGEGDMELNKYFLKSIQKVEKVADCLIVWGMVFQYK